MNVIPSASSRLWLAMPALIPVHNTLGALLIGTVLSSIIYGVTWLQVYSYYNSHCSRDRWPLKSLVRPYLLCPMLGILMKPCRSLF
ncbi:hypothetical protein EDB87DRAFT_662054 [Lactarius vividus]|nr:hypothetical protein EDB87DRAFT_662054 [Lactarius vividus]